MRCVVVVYGPRQRSRQDPLSHYPLERLPRMDRGQLVKEFVTFLLRMLNQRRLLWCYLGCGAGYPHPLPIVLPAP
jgi:hypothetical protein